MNIECRKSSSLNPGLANLEHALGLIVSQSQASGRRTLLRICLRNGSCECLRAGGGGGAERQSQPAEPLSPVDQLASPDGFRVEDDDPSAGKCKVKLCTTRLMTPPSDGESGRRPSCMQRKNPRSWPTTTSITGALSSPA